MENNILETVYDLWINSENYQKNSALENECYEKRAEKIKNIVGKNMYREIGDDVIGLACDAESAGFNYGFRYGIMFMNGILKGGDVIG